MMVKGVAYILGDDINTDLIISGRYKFSISDMKELSKHILEDLDPHFYSKLKHGRSLLVAGKNFGGGGKEYRTPHHRGQRSQNQSRHR